MRFTGSTGGKGFFAVMNGVLGALHELDQGRVAGVEFRFDHGAYADRIGDNWLEYYFDFSIPRLPGVGWGSVFEYREIPVAIHRITRTASRESNHRLIRNHLGIKPDVIAAVDGLCAGFGEARTIGIHFRGTDKVLEASPVTYDEVLPVVDRELARLDGRPCRLYVATDEADFVSFMKEHYGDAVLHQTGALRASGDQPVHLCRHDGRRPSDLGREALIDALVLSRTDHLIRTSSNLSLWSTFFNPHLEVTLISHPFGHSAE